MAFTKLKEWFRNRRKKKDNYTNSSSGIRGTAYEASARSDNTVVNTITPFVLLDMMSDDGAKSVPSHTGRGESANEGKDGQLPTTQPTQSLNEVERDTTSVSATVYHSDNSSPAGGHSYFSSNVDSSPSYSGDHSSSGGDFSSGGGDSGGGSSGGDF